MTIPKLSLVLHFLIFCTVKSGRGNVMDSGLIEEYLQHKKVQSGIVLACEDDFELTTNLTKAFLRVSTINMNRFEGDLNSTLSSLYYHRALIMDFDCGASKSYLDESASLRLMTEKYKWLIFSKDQGLWATLATVDMYINTDMTVAIPRKGKFKLYDVYNPGFKNGGQLNRTLVGHYSRMNGYNVKNIWSKYWDRKNMTGIKFNSAAVLIKDFDGDMMEYLNSDRDKTLNAFDRFHYQLMHHLVDFFNYTIVSLRRVRSYGYQLPNGSFDGLVGLLERKEIDLGQTALFFKEPRLRVMEYLVVGWSARPCFIFRHPKPDSGVSEVFLKPFSPLVWTCSLLAFAFVVICLKCSFRVENSIGKCQPEVGDESWNYSMLFLLAAICQQGLIHSTSMLSGRVVLYIVLLFSFIYYQFYSSSIVSFLLMDAPKTIKTLRQLLDSSLKAGSEDIVYTKDYIEKTTDPDVIRMYRKKFLARSNRNGGWYNATEGLDKMRKGGFAFHVDVATAYKIIQETFSEQEICELTEVPLFPPQKMVGNVPKHSPYREVLRYGYLRTIEAGLLRRQMIFWSTPKPACVLTQSSLEFHVGLLEFRPAILMLLIGFGIGSLILFAEIIHWKYSVPQFPYLN